MFTEKKSPYSCSDNVLCHRQVILRGIRARYQPELPLEDRLAFYHIVQISWFKNKNMKTIIIVRRVSYAMHYVRINKSFVLNGERKHMLIFGH
jgi:hypothetical protein